MNKNIKAKRRRSGMHNLFVGIGATAFFVLLIIYGIRMGNAEDTPSAKGKEQAMEITLTKTNFETEVL